MWCLAGISFSALQVHKVSPPKLSCLLFVKVSAIRTPMLIQGRIERTVTNLTPFKWEVT